MEIIMKVKCSPSPGAASSPHSTLKIVDHHHQLQQHTYTPTGYKSNTPPHNVIPTRTYTPTSHHSNNKYPVTTSTSSSCNDCSLSYCCNVSSCCVTTPPPQYPRTRPQTPQTPSLTSPFQPVEQYSNNSCQSVEEPEFVSIDDEKVKQYLIRLGQQQLQKQHKQGQQQNHRQQNRPQTESKIARAFSTSATENKVKPLIFEIIELDDEDEREKLKQIKQQAEQSLAKKKLTPNVNINFANRNTKSLDISLIPKTSDNRTQNCSLEMPLTRSRSQDSSSNLANHKIIAEIDLLESDEDDNDDYMNDDKDDDYDDNDDDDDDDTLPLVAVSCELQCDDDDEDVSCSENINANQSHNNNILNTQDQQRQTSMRYPKSPVEDVLIVGSDENKHRGDNLLVRWEEYEGQRERVFFECFLCGKKVQSSYNLRRHMMIHTGERPFGCDLCDRRFREFSDLKKHRRRHCNELNFLCMVCHDRKPVENDPTRCINCCTQSKNAVIMAAMKPATEADIAAENNARKQTACINKAPINPITTTTTTSSSSSLSSSSSSTATKPTTEPTLTTVISKPTSQQRTLPTISSVTSYNVAAIKKTKSPPPTSSNSPLNSNSINTKSSEETQRLLDNIPAVHRPGYNELGMITRKEFPCPLCNRAFGTRHNLKRHYMIHTGEKPFSCTKCRKPFREFSTLKKHMVTHIRDRWYKCMRCPVKFRDFLKYTEHKETHLNESDNEELPMATTKSASTKYGAMQMDTYIDSNDEDSVSEDWLECCECGQRFNEIDAYNTHLKEHDLNTQIFECYICKQQLKTRLALEEHVRQQHKQDIQNEDNMTGDDNQ